MEEISLKEILTIIFKGYKIIIIFVICSFLVSFIMGFITPNTYTSSSVLKVSDININPAITVAGNSLISGISSVIQVPIMNIDSYTQLIQNKEVLENSITVMDIKNKDGITATPIDIIGNINIETDSETNIINVNVKSPDAQFATDLSNTLSLQFILYLNKIINKNCDDILSTITERLIEQQQKINIETQKLKAYHESPYNPVEIESNINSLIEQIIRYKTELNDLKRSIDTDKLAISHLDITKDDNTVSNFKISTNTDNSFLNSDYIPSPGIEITVDVDKDSNIKNTILSIKKAEAEARLIQSLSDYHSLSDRLRIMENDLIQLQLIYADELQKYNIIQTDYQLSVDTYALYQKLHQQISIISSSDIARKNVTILSEAFVDESSRKIMLPIYVGIGVTLGLFIGVFVVLFKNYWYTNE